MESSKKIISSGRGGDLIFVKTKIYRFRLKRKNGYAYQIVTD